MSGSSGTPTQPEIFERVRLLNDGKRCRGCGATSNLQRLGYDIEGFGSANRVYCIDCMENRP